MKLYTLTKYNSTTKRHINIANLVPAGEAVFALIKHIDPTLALCEEYAHRTPGEKLLSELNDVAIAAGGGCNIDFTFT